MTISGSALTALFIGMAWALIKVVEYFISKNKKIKEPELKLTEKQERMLEEARNYSKDLFEMHNVYDANRTPLWIIPPELMKLVRENHSCLELLKKEIDDNLDDIKSGQSVVVDKITDLISSNKIMTERLGDLISALRKFPNGGSK
jgi:hypothetical protein